jgi:hypothetical protein
MPLGWNGASRCSDEQIASIRSCGSAGPSINGNGRIDGTAGTADAEPRPDVCNCSSASASPPALSLNSQMPMPSTPADAYARTSSSKLDENVVI